VPILARFFSIYCVKNVLKINFAKVKIKFYSAKKELTQNLKLFCNFAKKNYEIR